MKPTFKAHNSTDFLAMLTIFQKVIFKLTHPQFFDDNLVILWSKSCHIYTCRTKNSFHNFALYRNRKLVTKISYRWQKLLENDAKIWSSNSVQVAFFGCQLCSLRTCVTGTTTFFIFPHASFERHQRANQKLLAYAQVGVEREGGKN